MSVAVATRQVCTRCGAEKTPADFPRHKRYVSGRSSVCKVCRAEQARAYVRTATGAAVTAAAKARYRVSSDGKKHERDYQRAYRRTPSGRAAFARADRSRDPLKVAARKAVYHAVRTGRLVRGRCEGCGAGPTHAHHDDYSKPLVVRWFCRLCHDQLHAGAA